MVGDRSRLQGSLMHEFVEIKYPVKKKKVRIARIDGWNERTNERERRNIGSWPLSGLCLRLVRGTVVMRPCRRIRMVEIDRYRDWMEHRVWPCVPHEIQMRP